MDAQPQPGASDAAILTWITAVQAGVLTQSYAVLAQLPAFGVDCLTIPVDFSK